MNWKKATPLFIILTIVVIAIWDVATITQGGVETSISHTMIIWAYKYPIFPFTMGIVFGHLFWRMAATKETDKIDKTVRDKGE